MYLKDQLPLLKTSVKPSQILSFCLRYLPSLSFFLLFTPLLLSEQPHAVALHCSKRLLTFTQQCWKQQEQACKRTVEYFWAVSTSKWSHPFHLLWLSTNRHSSHGSLFWVGNQVSPLGSKFSHWDLSKVKISCSLSQISSQKTQVRKKKKRISRKNEISSLTYEPHRLCY